MIVKIDCVYIDWYYLGIDKAHEVQIDGANSPICLCAE